MLSRNFFSQRWQGQVPLAVLLWRDMLSVGTMINLTATFLAIIAIIQGANSWIAFALHLAPMPYNIFLLTAILRAPDRNKFASSIATGWLVVVTLV